MNIYSKILEKGGVFIMLLLISSIEKRYAKIWTELYYEYSGTMIKLW